MLELETAVELCRCCVCDNTVKRLKVLPCLHTICLPCTDTLQLTRRRYACPVCDEKHTIPNGGFTFLLESKVAEDIFQKVEPKLKEKGAAAELLHNINTSPVRDGLQQQVAAAERWLQKADEMIKREKGLQDSLLTGLKSSRKAITDYNNFISIKCEEKEKALNQRVLQQAVETDAKDSGLEEGGRELKEGDSVQLSLDIPENMEEFITGNVTHSSVGILMKIETAETQPMVIVTFPEKTRWRPKNLSQIVKSTAKAQVPYTGDKVRVKRSVEKPHFGRNRVKIKKSHGILKSISFEPMENTDDAVVMITFPGDKEWKGLYSEIELLERNSVEMKRGRTANNARARMQNKKADMEASIRQYKEKVRIRCLEKFFEEKKESEKTEKEVGDHLDMIESYHKKITSLVDQSTAILGHQVMPTHYLSQAERTTFMLQALNTEVRSLKYGVHSFDEWNFGDCLKIIQYNPEFMDLGEYVNGDVCIGSVGVFHMQTKDLVKDPSSPSKEPTKEYRNTILYPNKPPWQGRSSLFYKVLTDRPAPNVGDKCRFTQAYLQKPSASNLPRVNGTLTRVYITHRGAESLVEFPSGYCWEGLYQNIELSPGCGFEIGDKVTVNKSILRPSQGWGGVGASSIGEVVSIGDLEGVEEITVDFPECRGWVGVAKDLQGIRDLRKKDEVQVKLTVEEPVEGWRGVTHSQVGFLFDISSDGKCRVAFGGNKNWSCHVSEIELMRYRTPRYDVKESEREHLGDYSDQHELVKYLNLQPNP